MHSVATFFASTALAVTGPFLVPDRVLWLSPCTQKVHALAEKRLSGKAARATELLQYFAKPSDRLMQAIAAPFIQQAAYFETLQDFYRKKEMTFAYAATLAIPAAIPINIIWGLCQSILLITNGALQIVLPYYAVYDVYKGREAALEYANFRRRQLERQEAFIERSVVMKKVVSWLPVPAFPQPKVSLEDLESKNILSAKKNPSQLEELLSLMHPSILFAGARELIYS